MKPELPIQQVKGKESVYYFVRYRELSSGLLSGQVVKITDPAELMKLMIDGFDLMEVNRL